MATEKDTPQTSDPSPDRWPAQSRQVGIGDEASALHELQARFDEADRERAQFKAIAQRAQADLMNYRQQVERERRELHLATVERTIAKLLPILDDLQLALKHAPTESSDAIWVEGIRLIERRLLALLESEGVSAIAAEGKPFDPWQHEALFSMEDPSKEPGAVVMVIRQGYKLHDKVLRATQVAISQAPKPTSDNQAQSRQVPMKSGQVGLGGAEERKDSNG